MATPASMVVIKHGVSHHDPFDPGSPTYRFPEGKGILNLFYVRRATRYLREVNVMPFSDGMYHATINTVGMIDLLSGFSQHDAADAGFQRVNDDPLRIVFANLRWEVDELANDLKIFGPKSDPTQAKVFDLVAEEAQNDLDNSRSKES